VLKLFQEGLLLYNLFPFCFYFFGFGGGGTLTALGIEPCILSPGKSFTNFGCSTGLITLRISLFILHVFYGCSSVSLSK
jgi:hypothetical protein